ncbi:MAG TPA: PDZ domain-containing protein, partial [Polyangiaceae bacterium]
MCLALNACFAARVAQPARAPAAELAVHAQPASPIAPPPATAPAPASATPSAELSEPSLAGAEAAQPLLQPRSARERGWLGVELAKRGAADPGVLVRDVVRGSPAANSGVLVGDVILSVDGENVTRPEEV